MVAIIGLDPSSKKIAMAISIDGKKPTLKTRVLHKDLAPACHESYHYVRVTVLKLRKLGHVVHIFIEEPVVGVGGAYSTIRQSKTNGAMIAGAVSGGAEVHFANNRTWKKISVGNGNASKAQIKDWVREFWPVMYVAAKGDQDLMDALGILRYGDTIIERMNKIDKLADLSDMEPVAKRKRR